jgi:aspartyl-tRNA(Asn)/glutamyl-tRNA(Gln) amidotransferase subunit A
MDATDLCFLTAEQLVDLFRRGELSPVEVTEAVLARIEELNPRLNAFVTVTPERAREDARRAEQAYRDGDPGSLAGVPVSIKDLVPTKGIRTTRGSLLSADWVPDYDPVFVRRLYDAGVVMLGKTNTPEGGWKGETTNRVAGTTYNPWNLERTPGGSSGGAAAAVAAGLGPLAQGGDGAGSIRIPAAFSGIFGHKPSFGRVPYPGSSPTQLAHTGPMTRTVRDAALMLDVMAGPDPSDRHSLAKAPSFAEDIEGGIGGLRVAWSLDLGYATVDPEVATLTAAAAGRFEEQGCHVEEAHPGLDDPWELIDILFAIGQAGAIAERLDELGPQLDQGRLRLIERAIHWSAVDIQQAMSKRDVYWDGMRAFFERYDLLITPAVPVPAFQAGIDFPPEINGVEMGYLSWTPFTYPFNLTGQPSASVPCGFTADGLPVALQITGAWRDDATVLRASARFEDIAPWAGLRPAI